MRPAHRCEEWLDLDCALDEVSRGLSRTARVGQKPASLSQACLEVLGGYADLAIAVAVDVALDVVRLPFVGVLGGSGLLLHRGVIPTMEEDRRRAEDDDLDRVAGVGSDDRAAVAVRLGRDRGNRRSLKR